MNYLLELQISVYLCARKEGWKERKEYSLWIMYYRFLFLVYEGRQEMCLHVSFKAIHIFYSPGILCLSFNSESLFGL